VGFCSCGETESDIPGEIAVLAEGWTGEVVAKIDQSYSGWDVVIADADNDGQNEILTTSSPDSRLYLFRHGKSGWETYLLAENLARETPGMGLAVKVVDLDGDGKNEIILGTGQDSPQTTKNAFLYIFQMDDQKITKELVYMLDNNESKYTHGLATYDLNGDGLQEVISAYCGSGEIIRFDINKELTEIRPKNIYTLSGSGEESIIADVDNDGKVEYITSNGFRQGGAKVEIFELDEKGELITPPRIVVECFDGNHCFYASIVIGDVDNDGMNEMIVAWKREQQINKATLIGYRIGYKAEPTYLFEEETEDLGTAYFEKMMVIADADNDGKNELIVSSSQKEPSGTIPGTNLGNVFMYKISEAGQIERTLLLKFSGDKAVSSWLAVGDADNDGKNEIVLATGQGYRTTPGSSYVILIKKDFSQENQVPGSIREQ
jgi:hypothetical protein